MGMGNFSEFFSIGSQVPNTMLGTHTHTHTHMCFVCNKTMHCMIKPSNGRAQIQEKRQILTNGRLMKRFNEERNQILLLHWI